MQGTEDRFGDSPAPSPLKPEAGALSPAAERALKEAEDRRKSLTENDAPKEVGGRKGPEPTRYGDWEKKGIVSDF